MKTLFAAIALVVTSAPINAADFVNTDGSALSRLCIAAVESNEALAAEVEAQNISRYTLDRISCNDLSLNDFVKEYRANTSTETVNVVAFENANNSFEGQLCIAAATSNVAFQQAKSRLDGRVDADKVSCNGESLAVFAKQYNEEFND